MILNQKHYFNFRYPDYKPVPPPKSGPYKPVPPPKPKTSTNAPEGNYMNNGYASSSSLHYHSSNVKPGYMNGSNRLNDDGDSGQGSSLDRDYGLYNNGYKQPHIPNKDQYYYNLPQNHQPPTMTNGASPPRREGLDLTNNREYRGSAFELYKKPLSEAKPHPQQYYGNPTVAR